MQARKTSEKRVYLLSDDEKYPIYLCYEGERLCFIEARGYLVPPVLREVTQFLLHERGLTVRFEDKWQSIGEQPDRAPTFWKLASNLR